jgi:integrase
MARRPGIYGPYQHGRRWRIVIVNEQGEQTVESCASEEEARDLKRDLLRELEKRCGATVDQVLDKYEQHQRAKGNKPRSIETTRGRLEMFFGPLVERPLGALTPKMCSERYSALQSEVAVDTHRNALNEAKTFARWCVKSRLLTRSPLEQIEGVGKRKKGKSQLRIDEARRWLAVALELAPQHVGAAAACASLLFGARASEIAERTVRDLDDGGRMLWIPDAKTEAGRRQLEVPEALRPALLELTRDKLPTAPLFHGIDRHAVRRWVARICAAAGVPTVCAHAMRGLHSTLATAAGATPHVVAASLGHASFAVTREHYLDREVAGQTAQRRALAKLEGGE